MRSRKMPVIKEEKINSEVVFTVAKKMLVAARTSPKGRGIDNLSLLVINGNEIKKLSKKMKELGKKHKMSFFIRDAQNILQSPYLVLMGTKVSAFGLPKCGFCGFENCAEKNKHKNVPCAFNTGDLGIAIGSAVSIATDNRIDNRIMYSAGYAAIAIGLLPKNIKVAYGIPLCAKSKNPFFDRVFKL